MRPIALSLLACVTLSAAACATAEDQEARRGAAELASDGMSFGDGARLTGGEAQTCIPINQIRQSVVRSDQVIDWRLNNNRWYRTVLPQPCPMLGFEQRFAYSTSLTQLCAQDIITVLQGPQAQPGAACGLAQFRPIEPPPRRP